MLLAAGFGRRMVPVTLRQAKPTLPFLNRALLLRQLDWLEASGVDEVVVNVHHRPGSIRGLLAAAGNTPLKVGGLTVRLSPERDVLGTSGGVARAAERLRGDGPFVVANTDMLCGLDLTAAVAAHRRAGAPATLVLAPWREDCGFTPVRHAEGRLTGFGGDPPHDPATTGIFTGVHVLEESILERLPAGRSEFVPDLYRPLLAEGAPPAVVVDDGTWLEVGTPGRYLEGHFAALRGPAPASHRPWAPADEADGVLLGRGVALGDDVRLERGVVLGHDVQIGEGARLVRCVVMDGAEVADGADLEEVIVGPDVPVPAGEPVRRAVLALPDGNGPPEEPVRAWRDVWRADF
jgi:NDP-sugar pyrophosphorylase family protein